MKTGMRKHLLLTKELAAKLPALYATDGTPEETRKVPVKFFSPYSGWSWFCLEYSPEERVFFGLVVGAEVELGYFSLDELESVTVCGGVPAVERDKYWDGNTTLAQVRSGEKH